MRLADFLDWFGPLAGAEDGGGDDAAG